MQPIAYDTNDLSVYHIKGSFFDRKKIDYINDVKGSYTVDFNREYKDTPFIKFKNCNNYFLQFSNSSVGGKYFFYGSNLFIKGTDKYLRIKDLKIVANNCNLYLDLSEGLYGIPSNVFCSNLYIVGYPNDLSDFYEFNSLLADISLIKSNTIYMDSYLASLINQVNLDENRVYKIDTSNIEIIKEMQEPTTETETKQDVNSNRIPKSGGKVLKKILHK